MKRLAAILAVLFATSALAGEGADVFTKKCAACHGKDGKAQTPMAQRLGATDLTALKKGEKDVEKAVAEGKGKMPAFKGKLTDKEIHEVSEYVAKGLK